MANAPPPPYSEQPPPFNPSYAPQHPGYPPMSYPDPNAGKNYAGYPPQPGPPGPAYQPGPPGPGYQPGYYPPPQSQPPPVQIQTGQPRPVPATTTVVVTGPPGIIATGNCPHCRVGYLTEDFTCCGICLAIFFFPLGLICCLLMRDRRCSHCGRSF